MHKLRQEEAGCRPRGTQKWSFPVRSIVYTGPSDTSRQREAIPQHPDPETSSSSCQTLVTKLQCLLCPSQSPRLETSTNRVICTDKPQRQYFYTTPNKDGFVSSPRAFKLPSEVRDARPLPLPSRPAGWDALADTSFTRQARISTLAVLACRRFHLRLICRTGSGHGRERGVCLSPRDRPPSRHPLLIASSPLIPAALSEP